MNLALGEAKPLNDLSSSEAPDAALLKRSLDGMAAEAMNLETGTIDYAKIRVNPRYEQYRRQAAALRRVDPSTFSREDRLAFWLNLYNALTIDAVVSFGIRETVREIPRLGFFRRAAYIVGGELFSLDDIEHGILRQNRRHPAYPIPQFGEGDPRARHVIAPMDPRIHFALTCASRSCPAISFYDGKQLDAQLTRAAQGFLGGGGCDVDAQAHRAVLSSIFDWYAVDFGGKEGVARFLAQHHPEEAARRLFAAPGGLSLAYAPYDWRLNKG